MSQKDSKKHEIQTQLQSVLHQGIDLGVPGFSAAVFSSSGLLFESTAGVENIDTNSPLKPTHLLGVGSITKVFTTVVILQLIESGLLALSSTLSSILPASTLKDISHASEATVESLLSHSSGIDSWEDDPIWIVAGRGSKLDPSKIWTKSETLDYVRRPNPHGPKPGETSYSNSNFTLLGLVIETLTSNTAEAEIRRRVLEPCGMESTILEGFEPLPEGKVVSKRYHWATETFREKAGICPSFKEVRGGELIDATGSNLSVEWVTGGIISTPSDLVKFALAIRDGKLLSPKSLEVMMDWKPETPSMEIGHGLFRYLSPRGYGKWCCHFGSVLGYTGALMWKDDEDVVVSCLANVGTMHAGKVNSHAVEVVIGKEFLRLATELAELERD